MLLGSAKFVLKVRHVKKNQRYANSAYSKGGVSCVTDTSVQTES